MALLLAAVILLLAWADGTEDTLGVQQAYIGPGAGIALLGSFLAVFFAMLSAIAAVLTWPIRAVYGAVRTRRA
ncbi:MAG: hypothetical protein ACYSWU_16430, partial [Planctomycetota bacterium]